MGLFTSQFCRATLLDWVLSAQSISEPWLGELMLGLGVSSLGSPDGAA